MLPYGRQFIDQADIDAVVEVLRGDWLTCGPAVECFEQALAEYVGAKHVIAVSNGTAALHVAMLAAGIGPGNRVVTSPITFLASANCAEFVGATADFADIDPLTYNLSPAALEAAWQPDVKAVVPVDFAGLPCNMPKIAEIARKRGALVIEDAAHSLGSRFLVNGVEYKVGGHPWADMTTFSFHPVKTITTGEGGAIATNDDRLAARCRLLRNHGMTKEPQELDLLTSDLGSPTSEIGPWLYAMSEVGYNYRITDLQCALGLSQLKKLDSFITRRQEIVDTYNQAFASLSCVKTPPSTINHQLVSPLINHQPSTINSPPPHQPSTINHQPVSPPSTINEQLSTRIAWHLYVLQIDFAAIGKTRTDVMASLRAQGIGTQVHYIPVHLQPYYTKKYGFGWGDMPVAESYYARCLSLPLYPAMTDADVLTVINAVDKDIKI